MTNTDSPFGYTNDGTPVQNGESGWQAYDGEMFGREEATPARVLQPGEVAVQAADLGDSLNSLNGTYAYFHARQSLCAALAAQSEPATEDGPTQEEARAAGVLYDPFAPEPADQGEEPLMRAAREAGRAAGEAMNQYLRDAKAGATKLGAQVNAMVESATAPPADRTPHAATEGQSDWTPERVERLREALHLPTLPESVRRLLDPQWRKNEGHKYETAIEAYAAGRNDIIDALRIAYKPASGQPDGETGSDEPYARPGETADDFARRITKAAEDRAVERMRAELVAALRAEGDEWQGYDFLDRTYEVAQLVQGQALHDLADRLAQGGQQTEKGTD